MLAVVVEFLDSVEGAPARAHRADVVAQPTNGVVELGAESSFDVRSNLGAQPQLESSIR